MISIIEGVLTVVHMAIVSGEVVGLVLGQMKSMHSSLESSRGELCVSDQSSPPLGLSIISLSIQCVSVRVSPMATNAQSSMNPVDISHLPLVISIKSTL